MMDGKPLIIFFVTATISFLGSLQVGFVNLLVIQSVLRTNLRAGLWAALGGCLPEIVYAAAAVWAGMWLERHQEIRRLLEWSGVPIFFIIGIIIYFTPNRPMKAEQTTKQSFAFLKGLLVGSLNPQLFPYWLVILVQLGGYDLLRVQTLSEQIAFVVGTSAGAMGLLAIEAYLAFYFRERLLEKLGKFNMNRFLGVTFVVLAVGLLLKLLLKW